MFEMFNFNFRYVFIIYLLSSHGNNVSLDNVCTFLHRLSLPEIPSWLVAMPFLVSLAVLFSLVDVDCMLDTVYH